MRNEQVIKAFTMEREARAGTLTTINNINDMEYVPHGIYNVKIDIQDHKSMI